MKNISLFLIFITLIYSCKHEFEKPYWNTDLTTPLAFTELNIQDLYSDSTITIDTLSDNSITVIYQKELVDISIDSNLLLNSISTTKNVKLESINFSDKTISNQFTLGELLTSSGISFLYPDNSYRVIPAISDVINDILPIDANEYFEEMTLSEGFLDVKISNNLPTDVSNLEIHLRNEGENTNIIEITIPYLASGEVFEITEALADQTIYGNMEIDVLNADLVGTGGNEVLIQYQDNLNTDITIRDIVLFEGTAIFPNQEIFNEDTVVSFDIGDVRLTKVEVEQGGVEVIGVSTVQDTLKIEYTIPYATLNGQMFTLNFNLPPAPVGGSVSVSEFFDFSGYEIDLRGQYGDTVNTLYTYSRGWIDSSGIVTQISLEDSIFNTITVQNIVPSKAWGSIGKDTISGSEIVEFDFFNDINGTFNLEKINVNLVTRNYLGANGNINIKKLEGKSNNNNLELINNNINSSIQIAAATESENNNINFSQLDIVFDQDNSNIDELIELKPNAFEIDYELITNGNTEGFAYKGKGLNTELQINVPLFLSLDKIEFLDTSEVNFSLPPDASNNGSFTLLVENEYPLSASIELLLLDQDNQLIEELVGNQEILAGEINQYGFVEENKFSEITIPYNNKDNLENTKKIVFKVVFNTLPQNQSVKFFSDYSIKLKLIANFNYNIGQ